MSDKNVDFISRPVIGGWQTILPLILAGLILGSSVLLLHHYLDTLPKSPIPNEGRTYPLREHGAVAFATLGESLSVHGLMIAAFAAGAIGVANEKRVRARH